MPLFCDNALHKTIEKNMHAFICRFVTQINSTKSVHILTYNLYNLLSLMGQVMKVQIKFIHIKTLFCSRLANKNKIFIFPYKIKFTIICKNNNIVISTL